MFANDSETLEASGLRNKGVGTVLNLPHKAGLRLAWQLPRRLVGRLLPVLWVSLLVLAACRPETASPSAATYPAEVAVAWYDLTLELIRTTQGYTPPVAARTLGYLGVTLYETVRPGMPGYTTLAGQLNGLDELPTPDPLARHDWAAAANRALAAQVRALFPTAPAEQLAAIDALEEQFNRQFSQTVDAVTLRHSQTWGNTVAAAIYVWSRTDGGHEGYLTNFPADYAPPSGPGRWVKTPPAFSPPMQPYWGDNRPFVLTDGAACPAPPPPAYSTDPASAFYAEAYEVYTTVRQRNPQQEEIASFWADDPGRTATPSGHWVAILGQVLMAEEAGLDVAAVGYAKLGIAVADAFITCWHTKYVYHLVRPISYIQSEIDPTWNADTITDPVLTPPFPEYTSGHSVQSGAAATVLTAVFGENYKFTDRTHDDLGMAAPTFTSFAAAAQEAAISRLYGGIHYRSAIEQGLAQGQCVGEHVLALTWQQ